MPTFILATGLELTENVKLDSADQIWIKILSLHGLFLAYFSENVMRNILFYGLAGI